MELNSLHLQYVISLSFTSITTFIVAIFVYFRNPRNLLNRLFAFYTLSIAAWSFGQTFLTLAAGSTRVETLIWGRLLHIGVVFIPTSFVHFIFTILGLKPRKRFLLPLLYILSFFFLFLIPSRFFVADALTKLSFKYFIAAGVLYYPFVLFFVTSVSYGLFKLYKGYQYSTGVKRNQLKYLFWPSLFGYLGGAPNLLLTLGFEFYPLNPLGSYAVGIYILILSYAIIKYRLLDITVYATRAAIFLLVSLVAMAAAFGITSLSRGFLMKIFEENWWYIPLFLSMLFASIGYAIAIFAIRKIDEKRLQRIRKTQESIEEAGREMIEFGNMHRIAKFIPRYLIRLYKRNLGIEIEHVSIFIFDEKKEKFILEKSIGKKKLPQGQELALDDAINVWFTKKRKYLLKHVKLQKRDIDVLRYEDIDYWAYNDRVVSMDQTIPELLERIKNEMNNLEASICIPSIHNDKLLGFLLLGNKSQGMYGQEELDLFLRFATNVAAAFRVAQLNERLKAAQAEFIVMEKFATIGRLSTSAKHEIDNPLQLVAGGIERTLMEMRDMENSFYKFRERLKPMIDDIKRLSLQLTDEEKAIISVKNQDELKAKLLILDDAFSVLEGKGRTDGEFKKAIEIYCSRITKIQEEFNKIMTKTKNKREEIEDMVHLLGMVSKNMLKVKNIDNILIENLKKGYDMAMRIEGEIEAMYNLPAEMDKELCAIGVDELVELGFSFSRRQTYWENLSDTPVEKRIPDNLPKIKGYPNRLSLVLSNLTINAYQAMTDAGLKSGNDRLIRISAEIAKDDPLYIEIYFANKGPLILQENLERIFEQGFTTRKHGSGIGLYTARTQVEVNKGNLYARNITGFGPEFVVRLPIWKEGDKDDSKNSHS